MHYNAIEEQFANTFGNLVSVFRRNSSSSLIGFPARTFVKISIKKMTSIFRISFVTMLRNVAIVNGQIKFKNFIFQKMESNKTR